MYGRGTGGGGAHAGAAPPEAVRRSRDVCVAGGLRAGGRASARVALGKARQAVAGRSDAGRQLRAARRAHPAAGERNAAPPLLPQAGAQRGIPGRLSGRGGVGVLLQDVALCLALAPWLPAGEEGMRRGEAVRGQSRCR